MNRYNGITGKYERIPEAEPVAFSPPAQQTEFASYREAMSESNTDNRTGNRKPSSQPDLFSGLGGILSNPGLGSAFANSGLGGLLSRGGLDKLLPKGGVGGILSRLTRPNMELEDIILVGVLYLLYRESGDIEFLLIAGAMLFL